jgi:hypothetical protein
MLQFAHLIEFIAALIGIFLVSWGGYWSLVLGLSIGCAVAPGGFDSWPIAIILLLVAVILLFCDGTNLFDRVCCRSSLWSWPISPLALSLVRFCALGSCISLRSPLILPSSSSHWRSLLTLMDVPTARTRVVKCWRLQSGLTLFSGKIWILFGGGNRLMTRIFFFLSTFVLCMDSGVHRGVGGRGGTVGRGAPRYYY